MWVGCVACRRAGWLTGRARHPGIRAGSQPDQQPGIWASPSQPLPGEPAPPARPARRPSGQPVPDRSPKNALAVNAEGLPMHTSLTRPVHPPVAPVVGRRHNRQLFHHLSGDPPVVEQSHNRRRNTIYFLIRRLLKAETKGSLSLDLLVFMVNNRRMKI